MRAAALLTVTWATLSAQTVLPPERAAKLFLPNRPDMLKCQAEVLQPVLDFSFRFRTGYYVEYNAAPRLGPSSDEFAKRGRAIGSRSDSGDIGGHGRGYLVIPSPAEIDSINGSARVSPQRDSIDYLVSMLKGKTFTVSTPFDFASAMNQIGTAQKGK